MEIQLAKPVKRYVLVVCAAGIGLFAALVATGDLRGMVTARFLLFFAFVLLGEAIPIKVPRQGEQDEIITSTTFAYALVLTAGPVPAVLAQAVATLATDLSRRKPPWKALFNACQSTVSLVAAAGALELMTGVDWFPIRITSGHVPAILVAGAVLFLANNLLTATALAIAQQIPLASYLWRDLRFQAIPDGVLLAMAPVVAVVADRSLWLVPFLALPLAAVYKSAQVSLENLLLVGRLEESLKDLTELNQLNEFQALPDALTELPNRTLFRDRLHQAVLSAQRDGRTAAAMIIDLDRFKDINDTLGHHNGDILLQQIGPRLRQALRESDSIARLGGDEFAVLLPTVTGEDAALEVASRIQKALEAPFVVGELTLDVEASVGIALYPAHGRDVDKLLQRADLAMYVAKAQRAGVQVYAAKYDQYSPIRLVLLGELRRAIDENQLVLHYQPKVDFRNGRLEGVEALVRWQHPERGLVMPEEFIPFAEHTTLMRPLTLYVIDRALAQCQEWRRSGLKLTVAVNMSVRNLLDLKLPEEVSRLLEKWELPSDALKLEITESVLMAEPTRAMRVLTQLSSMGVGLSLDDFGTGYSSLAYLKELPVDEIKIDRSFVMNMARDENDAMIVRSTIDLEKNLGLRVVAEGVETQEIWRLLAALDCDVAQGFYLSRPLPAAEFGQWFRMHVRARATGGGNGHPDGKPGRRSDRPRPAPSLPVPP